jgi:hypothetical protein
MICESGSAPRAQYDQIGFAFPCGVNDCRGDITGFHLKLQGAPFSTVAGQ